MTNLQNEGDTPPEGQESDAYECPNCHSHNTYNYDERVFYCWDKDGYQAGVRVFGYFNCRDCQIPYRLCSVDNDDPDIDCDEADAV